MGRTLAFDRSAALTNATRLFWKEGYVNTSLKQLLSSMKMGEGSFYNTFKSKKALYLECLHHYDEELMKERKAAFLSDRSPREQIYDFFEVVINDIDKGTEPGCLFSNSLSQEVLVDEDFNELLLTEIDAMLNFLSQKIQKGIETGDIDSQVDSKIAAKVIFTYLHGLFRLSTYKFNAQKQREETISFLDSVLK